ncbi:hypothetical protein AAFF_G00006100 [Aldrovandia affinis]|uniref:Uncharacterized protein n=1 Tax=Aldrovandia affinis TaxID=143900 RepID=A0AAD7X304_9TELE|nr:hypothetical protein AAFF_G00006100 [Aldrovandia affinis]
MGRTTVGREGETLFKQERREKQRADLGGSDKRSEKRFRLMEEIRDTHYASRDQSSRIGFDAGERPCPTPSKERWPSVRYIRRVLRSAASLRSPSARATDTVQLLPPETETVTIGTLSHFQAKPNAPGQ